MNRKLLTKRAYERMLEQLRQEPNTHIALLKWLRLKYAYEARLQQIEVQDKLRQLGVIR